MAIKVKHDMNAAPAAAAGVASGRARRSMETARLFASGGGSGGRSGGGQGATAHPVAPPTAHAQLLSAHAPTPINWQLQRRENAAQEEARLKQAMDVAKASNDAAMERARLSDAGEDRRAKMRIDAEVAKQKAQNEFTTQRDEQLNKYTSERDANLAEQRRLDEEWKEFNARRAFVDSPERAQALIDAGTHEYGYSPEVQREYDKLMEDYNRGLSEGRYKADSPEGRQFKEELDRQIAALPKTLVQRKDPEGAFRNNTFTDAQGRIFSTDGKLIYNPADAETRRMEFQQRQMDAMRSAADRLYTELKKPRKVTRMVDDGMGGTKPETVFEERGDDEVMRIMHERYPQLYPNAPASQPPDQATQVRQAIRSWLYGEQDPADGEQAPAAPAQQPAPAAPAPSASVVPIPLPQNPTQQQAREYKSQFKRRS